MNTSTSTFCIFDMYLAGGVLALWPEHWRPRSASGAAADVADCTCVLAHRLGPGLDAGLGERHLRQAPDPGARGPAQVRQLASAFECSLVVGSAACCCRGTYCPSGATQDTQQCWKEESHVVQCVADPLLKAC